jgi:hypothetical protein
MASGQRLEAEGALDVGPPGRPHATAPGGVDEQLVQARDQRR